MSALVSDEIRQLVREALREFVPAAKRKAEGGDTLLAKLRSAMLGPKPARIEVKTDTAADLTAFARQIAEASSHEELRAGILSGRIEFVPASRGAPASAAPPRGQHQIAKGVVTELMVAEIGKTHQRLIIGKGVVVTPLARDRAREVKLEIVRERS